MVQFKQLLILFLLTGTATIAQVKPEEIADSLYKAKNFKEAGKYYLKATEKVDFKVLKSDNYYNAACCYALNGQKDSALVLLTSAVNSGYKNADQIKKDTDLESLHSLPGWPELINNIKTAKNSTTDPYKAKLITSDVKNFWKAYELAKKDTAHALDLYKKYYVEPASNGLEDYLGYKVKSLNNFVKSVNTKPQFYAAVRKNTLAVDQQKPRMIRSFVKFKQIYSEAQFPDIYFVIGAFNSGGTSTDAGLLIGLDQSARTAEVPVKELNLWQRNNFADLEALPHLIAHELIHFNQGGLKGDTTLLAGALTEGMADFIGELISGHTANERLFIWAKGKEKQIWADFEKEMYLNKARNWIANSDQETADKPADLGYWVGYQICKAYYDKSTDKNKAVNDILNIKNYKEFYIKSGAGGIFR
ncbi:TPR end-of-group domain-containing protein [Chitinophaga sp. ARDCPP14]|uniref:gliding motility protein GldB-related protein n=1 Tax=Chitinophaga sp. ARDCPP14 TaxID=3391139 RepID=UPI003F5237A7